MTLILYGAPLSPFVRKAEVVMREKGIAFESESVNILPMPDWFKAISPARRIPVLRDTSIGTEGRAGTLPDSSAICAFLEKKQPNPSLYPSEPFAHGRAIWLEEWADSELASVIGLGIFRPLMFPRFQGKPPEVEAAKATWHDKLPRLFDYLEEELEGAGAAKPEDARHLLGGTLSIADVAIGVQLAQLEMVAGLPDVRRWPRAVTYAERLMARPSFAPNLAICRKIIKERVNLAK
ncbi:MAG: glutathione S-transferase family protein [Deltaproteobacteria bacterium]|nr:glutathione S-transferase family protein [Deltaproteobacteria bacterium]